MPAMPHTARCMNSSAQRSVPWTQSRRSAIQHKLQQSGQRPLSVRQRPARQMRSGSLNRAGPLQQPKQKARLCLLRVCSVSQGV